MPKLAVTRDLTNNLWRPALHFFSVLGFFCLFLPKQSPASSEPSESSSSLSSSPSGSLNPPVNTLVFNAAIYLLVFPTLFFKDCNSVLTDFCLPALLLLFLFFRFMPDLFPFMSDIEDTQY